MRNKIHPLLSYLKYWLVQEDKYAVQSPSVFKIYTGLLSYLTKNKLSDLDLEGIRNSLLRDDSKLEIEDFGAGSKKLQSNLRKTASITKYSTSSRKYSKLYQYFCQLTPSEVVLELGTCVGINSRYLSRACPKGKLYTFEGSASLFFKAQEHQVEPNANYILGNLDTTLTELLKDTKKVDFALIDATHTYLGTKSYFESILPYLSESSILAIADIHWSKEMETIWQEIKKHPRVRLNLDFYECGIIFFDKTMPKESYVLKF